VLDGGTVLPPTEAVVTGQPEEAIDVTIHDLSPGPPPPAPPITPPPARTAAPGPVTRPYSWLGRLTLSLVVLALGVIGLLDLSGVQVAGGVYLAVPLVIIGAALVVGTWYGRARWLIVLGAVLAVALGLTAAADTVTNRRQSVTWQPASVSQLEQNYSIDVGDAVLNLSNVDFSGGSHRVSVQSNVGNVTVIVPSTVDVRASVRVNVGNADVLGSHWAGIGQSTHTVVDEGVDGPGGGVLVIHAATDVGNVEVRR
jgi:predicted membrane protein